MAAAFQQVPILIPKASAQQSSSSSHMHACSLASTVRVKTTGHCRSICKSMLNVGACVYTHPLELVVLLSP